MNSKFGKFLSITLLKYTK
ncbi:putative cation transporting ATPase [Schistosoma mansoni]|nr:putative cation transporting ATPase [Schistosoma mansoni]|eukprot:XP_018653565.1 putative cation transporting ATPase [Schistosoma mansoni]